MNFFVRLLRRCQAFCRARFSSPCRSDKAFFFGFSSGWEGVSEAAARFALAHGLLPPTWNSLCFRGKTIYRETSPRFPYADFCSFVILSLPAKQHISPQRSKGGCKKLFEIFSYSRGKIFKNFFNPRASPDFWHLLRVMRLPNCKRCEHLSTPHGVSWCSTMGEILLCYRLSGRKE